MVLWSHLPADLIPPLLRLAGAILTRRVISYERPSGIYSTEYAEQLVRQIKDAADVVREEMGVPQEKVVKVLLVGADDVLAADIRSRRAEDADLMRCLPRGRIHSHNMSDAIDIAGIWDRETFVVFLLLSSEDATMRSGPKRHLFEIPFTLSGRSMIYGLGSFNGRYAHLICSESKSGNTPINNGICYHCEIEPPKRFWDKWGKGIMFAGVGAAALEVYQDFAGN